jgi:hypothetical protein
MKIIDWLKGQKLNLETCDLVESEEGFISLPAWQWAMFVHEYENYRYNSYLWIAMFLLAIFVFLVFLPIFSR